METEISAIPFTIFNSRQGGKEITKVVNKSDLSRRGEAKIITEHFASVKFVEAEGRRELWIMYIHCISSLRRN